MSLTPARFSFSFSSLDLRSSLSLFAFRFVVDDLDLVDNGLYGMNVVLVYVWGMVEKLATKEDIVQKP